MSLVLDYIRDAAEIYRQSFATIRDEADLGGFPEDVARVVVRMIHTCGQVDLTEHVAFSPGVVSATHAALAAGAPQLHADVPGNLAVDYEYGNRAATEAAFASAHRVVRVTVEAQRIAGNPMEPKSCLAACDPADATRSG